MARKADSGWRDQLLTTRHAEYGFGCPAAGMMLPMVEYDRGEPVAIINYLNRSALGPRGGDVVSAYNAFGALTREDGVSLPFLTAVYDPFTWAMRLFPHNDAACRVVESDDWTQVTETQFVSMLYHLRGRVTPDLSPYGVTWSKKPWDHYNLGASVRANEAWPGQLMSERRRNYEPREQVRTALRNPCLDVDLAVIDSEDRVGLVVDYKAPGARVSLTSTNVKALSGLWTGRGYSSHNVPAMVVRYRVERERRPDGASVWTYEAAPVNESARNLLSFALGHTDADTDKMASAIAGAQWVFLSEPEWLDVLRIARDL